MAIVIRMPKMSDTMTEGIIAAWHKKVNDTVQSGQILAEVQTDKATMELEAYEKGTLLYLGAEVGQAVPINAIIAIIGQAGEDISSLLAEEMVAEKPATSSNEAIQPIKKEHLPANDASPAIEQRDRIIASPLAKKMAQQGGYDLASIQGTGDGGRIIKRDVEAYMSQQTGSQLDQSHSKQEYYELTPTSPMRKTIAKRLTESTNQIPHFYLQMAVQMDQIVKFRSKTIQQGHFKITYNDILIKAIAHSLRKHPLINSTWQGDHIRQNHHIHIGIAISIPTGLVVPVIRFADQLSLSEISAQTKELNQKAQNNYLQPADWEGATFTLSNLGKWGIDSFTAIINPPASCILAIGTIQQIPTVQEGTIMPGYSMNMTLSCDHRLIDGAVGAAFLQTLKNYLEDPLQLLI